MLGFGKRDCVLGIYLVGSNKTFKNKKLAKELDSSSSYKSYRRVLDVKKIEMNVSKTQFEWILDDDIVEDVVKLNKGKDYYKNIYNVAKTRLSKDYKGFGDDLIHTLAATILLVFSAINEELERSKPGAISIVVKVPKYVTMLMDKEAEDHNSINWLIDNNSFVQSIHEVFGERAYQQGYKGDILTVLRWTEL